MHSLWENKKRSKTLTAFFKEKLDVFFLIFNKDYNVNNGLLG